MNRVVVLLIVAVSIMLLSAPAQAQQRLTCYWFGRGAGWTGVAEGYTRKAVIADALWNCRNSGRECLRYECRAAGPSIQRTYRRPCTTFYPHGFGGVQVRSPGCYD